MSIMSTRKSRVRSSPQQKMESYHGIDLLEFSLQETSAHFQ